MDERPETPANGEIVENAILSQQRRPSIQQFIENLNVGNPGMLSRQKHEFDRLATQTAAELSRERRCLADAFVNNDPFDTFHDLIAFSLPAAVLGTGATFIHAVTDAVPIVPVGETLAIENAANKPRLNSQQACRALQGIVPAPVQGSRKAKFVGNPVKLCKPLRQPARAFRGRRTPLGAAKSENFSDLSRIRVSRLRARRDTLSSIRLNGNQPADFCKPLNGGSRAIQRRATFPVDTVLKTWCAGSGSSGWFKLSQRRNSMDSTFCIFDRHAK
jgi:hypothetical protein